MASWGVIVSALASLVVSLIASSSTIARARCGLQSSGCVAKWYGGGGLRHARAWKDPPGGNTDGIFPAHVCVWSRQPTQSGLHVAHTPSPFLSLPLLNFCKVRTARPVIEPNEGFKLQLRLFELMGCEIDEANEDYQEYLSGEGPYRTLDVEPVR